MRSYEKVQAAESVIVPKGEIRGNNGSQSNGLMGRESIASMAPCAIVRCRAMLSALIHKNGCRLGGLRVQRRFIATSRSARGFSFGVNRKHGLIAPVPLYGSMPCGKPSGLLCPFVAVRQPARRLPPSWRLVGDFFKSNKGIFTMMRTLSRNVSTAFPNTPEPAFLPVESLHKRSAGSQKADTLNDVADAVDALLERCAGALDAANLIKNAARRNSLKAAYLSYVEELVDFCRQVEADTTSVTTMEVCHG